MNTDGYLTISELSTSKYVDRKSTFYAFAIPVQSEDEVEEQLRIYRKKYYDARHVCYAFCLNADRSVARSSDNGEPSGTAGRPIQGVISSHNLTNVLIIVVRYFGGIKLGTPGLIAAYRESAEQAIAAAQVVERTEDLSWHFTFPYAQMNNVMTAVKSLKVKVVQSDFAMDCSMTITAPKTVVASLQTMLKDFIC